MSLRTNTVIRKNDLAVLTEQKTITKQVIIEVRPKLIHMIACKTVGQYRKNQEKLLKIGLEEAKQIKAAKNVISNWEEKLQAGNSEK